MGLISTPLPLKIGKSILNQSDMVAARGLSCGLEPKFMKLE